MPTSIKNLNRIYRRTYWRLTLGFSIFYIVALVGGLSLLVSNPKVATWVSDAAQAEFAGNLPPATPEAERTALPDQPRRQAKAE